MKVRKTLLRDGDGLGNQACVAVDLAPLAGQTPAGPGGDVAGKTAPHKSRRNNTTGGKPPRVINIVKVGKNILSKFEGGDWAKSASGNVTSQALSTCLAECQFERCAASKRCVSGQRFCSAAISSKSTGSAVTVAATVPVEGGGGRDKKSATTFFKPGRYKSCTLNSEINAKWRCCLGEIGVEM